MGLKTSFQIDGTFGGKNQIKRQVLFLALSKFFLSEAPALYVEDLFPSRPPCFDLFRKPRKTRNNELVSFQSFPFQFWFFTLKPIVFCAEAIGVLVFIGCLLLVSYFSFYRCNFTFCSTSILFVIMIFVIIVFRVEFAVPQYKLAM